MAANSLDLAPLGEVGIVHADVFEIPFRRGLVDVDEAVRLGHREGAQEDAVDQRETATLAPIPSASMPMTRLVANFWRTSERHAARMSELSMTACLFGGGPTRPR